MPCREVHKSVETPIESNPSAPLTFPTPTRSTKIVQCQEHPDGIGCNQSWGYFGVLRLGFEQPLSKLNGKIFVSDMDGLGETLQECMFRLVSRVEYLAKEVRHLRNIMPGYSMYHLSKVVMIQRAYRRRLFQKHYLQGAKSFYMHAANLKRDLAPIIQ